MIYDLSKNAWKAYVIIAGLFFVPFCVAFIILTILDFSTTMLIVTICLNLVYAIIIVIIRIVTNNRVSRAIFIEENVVEIVTKEFNIKLGFDELVEIEYYRLISIKTWLLVLFNCPLPTYTYITYINKYGVENYMFIGYLDYKDVKEIAQKTNTKLKVH